MDYLRFLYGTLPGRLLLKPLTAPWLSRLSGHLLDLPISKILIPPFVRANHIDLSEYEEASYHSFNDFFCRKIRPSMRPVDPVPEHLISPCDGLLSVYPVSDDLVLNVKQSSFTVTTVCSKPAASERWFRWKLARCWWAGSAIIHLPERWRGDRRRDSSSTEDLLSFCWFRKTGYILRMNTHMLWKCQSGWDR